MDDSVESLHLKLVKDFVKDHFDKHGEVPFGYNGILYKVSRSSGIGYCLVEIHQGVTKSRCFATLDEVFHHIEYC